MAEALHCLFCFGVQLFASSSSSSSSSSCYSSASSCSCCYVGFERGWLQDRFGEGTVVTTRKA